MPPNNCSLSKCLLKSSEINKNVQSNNEKTTTMQLQKILKINNSTIWSIEKFATNAKITMQLCYFLPLTMALYQNANSISSEISNKVQSNNKKQQARNSKKSQKSIILLSTQL